MKRNIIAAIVIAAAGALLYANALESPFAFDDGYNIADNTYLRMSEFSFVSLYEAALRSPSSRRPVANMSFALNHLLGGYDVRGYHVVNTIIHVLNGILVFFLAGILFRSPRTNGPGFVSTGRRDPDGSIWLVSLFSALIFVSHPIQTQSVGYIVQRMNTMAVMFYLLALLLYLCARMAAGVGKRRLLWSCCGLSWLLALGSKEIAIALPLVILLCEWYFMQDLDHQWLKKNSKPLVLIVLILLSISLVYMGGVPLEEISASFAKRNFTLAERVLTQFRVVILYISLLLLPLPSRLNLLHTISTSHSLLDPITTLLSLVSILVLIGIAVALAKRHRIVSFLVLWFFIHLVIESSVIGLEMVYEHRLYLPLVGSAMLLGYALWGGSARGKAWYPIVASLVVLLLGVGTYQRNQVWQSETALWTDVVSKSPDSHRAENNLGHALAGQGDVEGAKRHYENALSIRPNYADANYNLGVWYKGQGDRDQAMDYLSEALRINPGHAGAHNGLALLLEDQGRAREAARHYGRALQLNPRFAEAHNNFGILLEGQGEADRAILHYREAIRYKPGFSEACNNLGIALTRAGSVEEGISWFLEALEARPHSKSTHNNLGAALSQHGDLEAAIRHFTRALEIDPGYTDARRNLNIALGRINGSGDLPSPPNAIPLNDSRR